MRLRQRHRTGAGRGEPTAQGREGAEGEQGGGGAHGLASY